MDGTRTQKNTKNIGDFLGAHRTNGMGTNIDARVKSVPPTTIGCIMLGPVSGRASPTQHQRVFLESPGPQISCNQRSCNSCYSQNCNATSLNPCSELTSKCQLLQRHLSSGQKKIWCTANKGALSRKALCPIPVRTKKTTSHRPLKICFCGHSERTKLLSNNFTSRASPHVLQAPVNLLGFNLDWVLLWSSQAQLTKHRVSIPFMQRGWEFEEWEKYLDSG